MTSNSATPAAIVTGATRGIGRGIAGMLARRGCNLTIAARDEGALGVIADEFEQLGISTNIVAGDVGKEGHAAALVEGHMAAFGRLDSVIFAAGIGTSSPIAGYPEARLSRQIDVNFRAPFLVSALAIPHMRATSKHWNRVARFVAIASLEGLYPEPGLAAYAATKSALLSLTAAINAEERINGVMATAISPGYVDTDMSDWISDRIPKASMLEVDDVVRCVEMILDLSPQALVPHLELHRRTADPYKA